MTKFLFFLSELNDQDLDWLVEIGTKRKIPSGTTLIYEGNHVDTLYIMLDGTLVVSTAEIGERELARLYKGEVVGEMSFVDSRPPSATVKTMEPSQVLAIPRRMLAQKLEEDESFASRFYRALAIMLSHRLRGTVKQLGYRKDQPPQNQENGTLQVASGISASASERFEELLQKLEIESKQPR